MAGRRPVGYGGMDWSFRQLLVEELWDYFGLKKEGREYEPLNLAHMQLVDGVLLLAETLPAPPPEISRLDLEKLVKEALSRSPVLTIRSADVGDIAAIVDEALAKARR